jgi:hypothetical protein
MSIDKPDFLIFIVFAPLTGFSIIVRQLVRELLFQRVLKMRTFAVGSSWYSVTQSGIGTSLPREVIWGETSRKMLKEKQLRSLILAARMVSITLYLGLSGIVLTMLWLALLHYR